MGNRQHRDFQSSRRIRRKNRPRQQNLQRQILETKFSTRNLFGDRIRPTPRLVMTPQVPGRRFRTLRQHEVIREKSTSLDKFLCSITSRQIKLSKTHEKDFTGNEKRSVPHELYTQLENESNERRPQSMSPKPEERVLYMNTGSNSRCFRSKSTDLQNINESYSNQKDRRSVPPELCNVRRYEQSKSLPDVLRTDRMSLPPNVPKVGCEKGEQPSWDERQGRIEGALKWLRSELVSLFCAFVV